MKTLLLQFACAQTDPLPRMEKERFSLLCGVMNIKDWEHIKISCVIFFLPLLLGTALQKRGYEEFTAVNL